MGNSRLALSNCGLGGDYLVTLTITNGSLIGTSTEDVHIAGGGSGGGGSGGGDTETAPVVISNPANQSVFDGEWFTFTASASGNPSPDIQWQVSTDGGINFIDIAGATSTSYTAQATLADEGSLYQALFTNEEGSAVTTTALLSVSPLIPEDTTAPDAPLVALAQDSGASYTDHIMSDGSLALGGIEDDALVEYSVDGGLSWTTGFTPVQGYNSVEVRQTDAAGNVSDAALLNFLLDTEAPLAVDPALVQDIGSSNADGITSVGIHVVANSAEVTTVNIPIGIV